MEFLMLHTLESKPIIFRNCHLDGYEQDGDYFEFLLLDDNAKRILLIHSRVSTPPVLHYRRPDPYTDAPIHYFAR